MYQELVNKIKPELEKTVEYLKSELANLRTGRATPSLIENIKVDSYGVVTPLKQLAAITSPEPRLLVIQPWDKNILNEIEKAIAKLKLGLQIINDGQLIRAKTPLLTEETRKESVGILHQKLEEARVSIRHHREKVWKELQNMEREGKISEDEKFKGKDDLQELIDQFNKKIDELGQKKEEEITTI